MQPRVVFNGVEYASVDEMPPDVRYAYEQVLVRLPDKDRDGIPDILQASAPDSVHIETHSRYVVNGREYRSPDEMPPDVRAIYEGARRGALRRGTVIGRPVQRRPGLRISCGTTLLFALALAAVLGRLARG